MSWPPYRPGSYVPNRDQDHDLADKLEDLIDYFCRAGRQVRQSEIDKIKEAAQRYGVAWAEAQANDRARLAVTDAVVPKPRRTAAW